MSGALAVLDEFFSRYLECDLKNVAPGRVWVIPADRREVLELHYDNVFVLWLIASGNRCVISVQRVLEEPVKRVVNRLALGDFHRPAGQQALLAAVAAKLGHRSRVAGVSGPLLFATPGTFHPQEQHYCKQVTFADVPVLKNAGLYGDYLQKSVAEGTCFAAFVDGEPVAVAGTWEVPHMVDRVADICLPGTIPARRREGFGKSVLSGTTGAVLRSGRIPVYLTSDRNVASINTARAVGYQPYGWQFRVEVVPETRSRAENGGGGGNGEVERGNF